MGRGRRRRCGAAVRALAVILALAAPAAAQDWPFDTPGDEFTLDRLSENYAVLEYWNSDFRNSDYAPPEITNGDLTVRLWLELFDGPEVLTVIAPEGWIAVPETISVIDGETGVVELFRGEFLGM